MNVFYRKVLLKQNVVQSWLLPIILMITPAQKPTIFCRLCPGVLFFSKYSVIQTLAWQLKTQLWKNYPI